MPCWILPHDEFTYIKQATYEIGRGIAKSAETRSANLHLGRHRKDRIVTINCDQLLIRNTTLMVLI